MPGRARLIAGGAVVLSGLVGVAVLLLVRGLPGDGTGAEARQKTRVAASPYVFERGRTYDCDVRREDGRLYAGHSDTLTALLEQIGTSWDVAEAQCLLNHHGYDVGAVDGVYGRATEKAVKRLQDDAGLVVDGVVGEHTWKVLRR
ncbi:peptidoglycan-binding protein [Streptomyces sp. CC228A]|uniref:peptidoglycan-binding domain-containing protein n=1 Tax=Streptomyces sp. CC228A TaxID=2898186 RepID=UPI001F1F58ED|nr:peptidoglycan-binding domain-containing protein [Streptomyces sp. CC228A]